MRDPLTQCTGTERVFVALLADTVNGADRCRGLGWASSTNNRRSTRTLVRLRLFNSITLNEWPNVPPWDNIHQGTSIDYAHFEFEAVFDG